MDPNTLNRWRRQCFADYGLGEFGPSVQYTDAQGRKRWRKGAYVGYNLHELRHTQATLLIGSGAGIKTVQQRLGHSSASLTMNTYAHFIAQNDRQAANTIGEILADHSKEDEPEKPTLSGADRVAIAQQNSSPPGFRFLLARQGWFRRLSHQRPRKWRGNKVKRPS